MNEEKFLKLFRIHLRDHIDYESQWCNRWNPRKEKDQIKKYIQVGDCPFTGLYLFGGFVDVKSRRYRRKFQEVAKYYKENKTSELRAKMFTIVEEMDFGE